VKKHVTELTHKARMTLQQVPVKPSEERKDGTNCSDHWRALRSVFFTATLQKQSNVLQLIVKLG
jgi:hypothetical protein